MESYPEFPCDSTLNQLYDSERFDAYRALGKFAMANAYQTFKDEFVAALEGAYPVDRAGVKLDTVVVRPEPV
jgi:hypothetical protein